MEEIFKKVMKAVVFAYFDGEDVFENGMGQVLLMVLDEQRRRSQEQARAYCGVIGRGPGPFLRLRTGHLITLL